MQRRLADRFFIGGIMDKAKTTERENTDSATLSKVLEELTKSGTITPDVAERILHAPRFAFRVRETLSYLAGVVMLIGAGFTVAPAFRNSSPVGIAVILYVLGVAFGVTAWRLRDSTDWKKRLAEVFEFLATAAIAVATGIVLMQAGMSGQPSVMIPAFACAVWAYVRRKHSQFAWAVTFTAGVLVATTALVTWIEPSQDVGTLLFVAATAVLLTLGLSRLSLAFLPRAAGSLVLVISAFSWYGNHESVPWTLVVLAIGVVIFVRVSTTPWRELLVASAVIVVAGTVVLAARLVTNDVARGVVMLAIGGATLAAVGSYARRTSRRADDH